MPPPTPPQTSATSAQTPDVSQIIKDPNFLGLPRAEKQKVLLRVDPSRYGKLPADQQLEVLDKLAPPSIWEGKFQTRPGGELYDIHDIEQGQPIVYDPHNPNAVSPATGALGRRSMENFPEQVQAEKASNLRALPGVGAAAGGVIGGPLAIGVGAGLGKAAENLAETGRPGLKSATETGAIAGGTAKGLDLAISGIGMFLKPFLERPLLPTPTSELESAVARKSATAADMAKAEEGLRQSITAAPRAIRKNVIAPAYPQIDSLVDIYTPGKQAVRDAAGNITEKPTAQLARTREIYRQIQSLKAHAADLLAQTLTAGPGEELPRQELLDTLDAIENKQSIPFDKAQRLRSALNSAIASGQGHKLPFETYNDLRSVRDLVDAGMRSAARADGKLAQFDAAETIYKKFQADFYNSSAPLKQAVQLRQPNMTGKTMQTLLRPENADRAEAALRYWGMDAQADALAKFRDMPDREQWLKYMKEYSVSGKEFNRVRLAEEQAADAEKVAQSQEAIRKARATRRNAVLGVGGVYGTYKLGKDLLGHAGLPSAPDTIGTP